MIIFVSRYIMFNHFPATYSEQLDMWYYLYISIQVSVLLIKVSIGIQISRSIEGIKKRLKLFMYAIPNLDTSYGFSDLGMLGVDRAVAPILIDVVDIEFMMANELMEAECNSENYKIKTVRKKKKELEKRYMLQWVEKRNNI